MLAGIDVAVEAGEITGTPSSPSTRVSTTASRVRRRAVSAGQQELELRDAGPQLLVLEQLDVAQRHGAGGGVAGVDDAVPEDRRVDDDYGLRRATSVQTIWISTGLLRGSPATPIAVRA